MDSDALSSPTLSNVRVCDQENVSTHHGPSYFPSFDFKSEFRVFRVFRGPLCSGSNDLEIMIPFAPVAPAAG
jgi:hypothetical protein